MADPEMGNQVNLELARELLLTLFQRGMTGEQYPEAVELLDERLTQCADDTQRLEYMVGAYEHLSHPHSVRLGFIAGDDFPFEKYGELMSTHPSTERELAFLQGVESVAKAKIFPIVWDVGFHT